MTRLELEVAQRADALANPLKVLHLIAGLGVGGAEVMLNRLVSAMDPLRFSNRVVSMTSGGPVAQRLIANGIPVSHLGMAAGIPDPRGWLRLRRILVRFRPQVVQTWMYHADLLGALAMGGLPDTHLVWGLHHSDLSWRLNKPQTLLVARLCAVLSRRAPQVIICCSEATRRAHRAIGYDSEKLVVIHNGYDTALFRPDEHAGEALRTELRIPRQSPVISLIARFHPQKDHQNFVKAASIIHRSSRDAHFVLCGAGAVAENRVLAEWIGCGELAGRFHLVGTFKDVRRVMAGSTVVASSSAGEGMSNVIGEAMACGAVCVVTDVGDSARVVGNAGIVVPTKDPQALADGILLALGMSPEFRRSLGAAARRRIEDRFGLSHTVYAYQQLYRQVAENPNQCRAGRSAS